MSLSIKYIGPHDKPIKPSQFVMRSLYGTSSSRWDLGELHRSIELGSRKEYKLFMWDVSPSTGTIQNDPIIQILNRHNQNSLTGEIKMIKRIYGRIMDIYSPEYERGRSVFHHNSPIIFLTTPRS